MKSIIEDIYMGRRGDSQTIQPSEEYWKVHEEVSKQYDKIANQLTAEQKNALDELCLITGGLESEHGISCFKEGFKIGLLVAIEAFI